MAGVTELKLKGVGACAFGNDKKGGVIIAYLVDDTAAAGFVAIEQPKKRLYETSDILSAVAAAEKANRAVYNDDENKPFDICICRSAGRAYDFVGRDTENNRFVAGFTEVTSARPRFKVAALPALKFGQALQIGVEPVVTSPEAYPEDSVEYAIVNAYNASLLARVFTRENLYLETQSGGHVRVEVRTDKAKYVAEDTLFVTPCEGADGFIDYYKTEAFNYVDGKDEAGRRAYEIRYRQQKKDYYLINIRN